MQYGNGALGFNQRSTPVIPLPSNAAHNGLHVDGFGTIVMGGPLDQATIIELAGRAFLINDTGTGHPYAYFDSNNFQQVSCLGDWSDLVTGDAFAMSFGNAPYIKTRGRKKYALIAGANADSDVTLIGDAEQIGPNPGFITVFSDTFTWSTQNVLMIKATDNQGAGTTVQIGRVDLLGTNLGIDDTTDLFSFLNGDLIIRDNPRTGTFKPMGRNGATGEIETVVGFNGAIVIPAVGTITITDGIITNFV